MKRLLFALVLCGLPASSGVSQEISTRVTPTPLTVGEVVRDSLTLDARHSYIVELEADQFVYGEADQRSVDVVVTIEGPQGVNEDFNVSAHGAEPFHFTTPAAGAYRLEVAPFREASGTYTIEIERAEAEASTPAGRVDQLMAPFDDRDRPGGVVAVIEGGEVTFAEAYGMADLTHGVPNTPETLFNLGSVTKQFAGLTFAILAEEGTLSLEDDVRTYLPELPDFGTTVTLRHLLNHTSGYREVYGVLGLQGRRVDGDILEREDALAVVENQPELQFEPGSEFLYNSTAYVLLTEIAERVTGISWPEWMQQNVFRPLGMTSTTIEREPGEVIPGSAYSYTFATEGGYREDFEAYAYYGATDIYTTVHDLAKWLRNFRTSELGGPGVMERMLEQSVLTSGDTLDYTLGLFLDEHRGLHRIQHGGSTGGYRAFLAYYPELDAGVAVLGNTGLLGTRGIAEEVVEAFFSEFLSPEEADQSTTGAEAVAVDSELLERYAGDWVTAGGPGVRFFVDDGRLFAQPDGQPPAALIALADTLFGVDIPGVDARISFHIEPDGSVERGTLGTSTIRRGEPWSPSADELRAYAGRYFSEEVEEFYSITAEEEGLELHHRRLGDMPLRTRERDSFGGRWPVSEILFERDENGGITGFRVSSGRTRGVLFEKQG